MNEYMQNQINASSPPQLSLHGVTVCDPRNLVLPDLPRGLLHPALHALRPDRPLDAGPSPVQTLAGDGLPAVLRLRLQHRAHQLRPLPVRYAGGEWKRGNVAGL